LADDLGSCVCVETRIEILPGQYFDAETGLHQNWHRDYDPSIGRYLQSDPMGLEGGLSTYGYALQNPLARTDRLGLLIDTDYRDVPMPKCRPPAMNFGEWIAYAMGLGGGLGAASGAGYGVAAGEIEAAEMLHIGSRAAPLATPAAVFDGAVGFGVLGAATAVITGTAAYLLYVALPECPEENSCPTE
jgi:RHS repeat-associated protein